MVPADHGTTPKSCWTTWSSSKAVAGARADDAAQLDRPQRKARRSISRWKAPAEKIRVFTTRVDTIYGATCVILAPEHPLREGAVRRRELAAHAEGDGRRPGPQGSREPGEGQASSPGHYAVNPFSGEKVPVWVGNFVLMGYGTGAIMAVPAHDERDFEFCTKYGIPMRAGDPAGGRRAGSDPRRRRSPTTASWRTPANGPAWRARKRAGK